MGVQKDMGWEWNLKWRRHLFDSQLNMAARFLCDVEGCHIQSVATCPFAGERRRGSRVRFPKEERCAESPPTFICGKRRKNRRKLVKMKILSSGVVFTLEEGISTSHVCLKGQQPTF